MSKPLGMIEEATINGTRVVSATLVDGGVDIGDNDRVQVFASVDEHARVVVNVTRNGQQVHSWIGEEQA